MKRKAGSVDTNDNGVLSKKGKEWYKFLLNNLGDAVFIFHVSGKGIPGKFIEVNDSACKSLGYSREELLEMSVVDINPSEKLKKFGSNFKIIKKEKEMIVETEHIRKDGSSFPVEINIFLFDLDGNSTYLAIARDITERNGNEAKLNESEKKYPELFDSISAGIIITDSEGMIMQVNLATVEILGYDNQDELVGRLTSSLYADILERDYVFKELLDKGSVKNHELRFRKKDGTIIDTMGSAILKRDKDGKILKLEGFFTDITDKKKAERHLEEQKNLFEIIISSTHDLIVLKDNDSVYTAVNSAFCNFIGLKEEDIIGKTDFDLFPKSEAEMFVDDDRKIIESGLGQVKDEEVTGEEGKRWLQVAKIPVLNKAGENVGILCNVRDVTEQKKAEEAIKKSEIWNKTLLEAIPDLIFVFKKDGTCVAYHSQSDDELAVSKEQVIGMNIKDVGFSPEILDLFYMNIDIALRTNEVQTFEYELNVPKDLGYWEGRAIALNLDEVLFMMRNITKRKKAQEALRESEEKFSTAFELSPDAININSMENGSIIDANQAFCDMLGYEKSEIIGLLPENCGICYDAEVRNRMFKELMEYGEIRNFEGPVMAKSGEKKIVSTSARVIKLNGKDCAIFVTRDISKQKKSEQEIIESEEKYRKLFDNSIYGVAISKGNKSISANKKMLEIFGYDSLEEFLQIPLLDLVAPESKEIVAARIKKRRKGGKVSSNLQYKIIRKDGQTRDIELYVSDILLGNEKYAQGVFRDITESKKAERELKESEKKYSTLVENAKDGVSILQNDRFIFINKELEKITGYSKEDFKKKNFLDFVAPEFRPLILERYKKRMLGEKVPSNYEMQIICEDGTRKDVELSANLIEYNGSKATMGILRDISGRKKTQQALIESEKKYRSLFENMTSGFAFHKMIFDKKGNPLNYIFLEINDSFEKNTGLKREDIIGRKVTEVIPDVGKSKPNLISIYGKVASSGKDSKFELFFEPFDKWYTVSAFSPEKGYFVTVFDDITERKNSEKILKDSEEKFRSLAEKSPNMIFINKNGRIVFANTMCQEIMGYTIEEFYSPDFDFMKLIAPESIGMIKVNYGKHMKMEDVIPYEYSLVAKDGKGVDAIISTKLIDYGGGKAILGIVTDITERKKSEKELKKYRDRLEKEVEIRTGEIIHQRNLTELITEGIEEGILLFSDDFKVQWANKRQRSILGLNRNEIIGKKCQQIIKACNGNCDNNDFNCIMDEVRRNGVQSSGIQVQYDKYGKKSYCEITVYPLRDGEKIQGYIQLARDVTERIRYQKKINELKEFNENIVHKMEEGVLIENDEGYITFTNPRMLQMLNTSSNEIIGKHWSDIFSQDSIKNVESENILVKEGRKGRYEASLRLGNRSIPVMVSSSPLVEKGIYVGNLKVFVDITKRKDSEEKLLLKTLKYKIEKGKTYLIAEKSLKGGSDVFKDLINAGYDGLIISRAHMDEFQELMNKSVEYLWVGETEKGEKVLAPGVEMIYGRISDFMSRNTVILLDRLDYLIVQNGFNEVLKFLHKINETAYLSKTIVLVVVDPDTLSNREMSLLENEINKLEHKVKIKLEKELHDILKFIKDRTSSGQMVVHSDITNYFNISRPTTVKRLKELKIRGFLIDHKMGKFKSLELTNKGNELF